MTEPEMQEISCRIFGTPDYASVLEILPPYDGAVKQFLQETGYGTKHKGDSAA